MSAVARWLCELCYVICGVKTCDLQVDAEISTPLIPEIIILVSILDIGISRIEGISIF